MCLATITSNNRQSPFVSILKLSNNHFLCSKMISTYHTTEIHHFQQIWSWPLQHFIINYIYKSNSTKIARTFKYLAINSNNIGLKAMHSNLSALNIHLNTTAVIHSDAVKKASFKSELFYSKLHHLNSFHIYKERKTFHDIHFPIWFK